MNTTTERPVRRCPYSGLIELYPAYEGWRPSEPHPQASSWLLVGLGLGLVGLALWGLGL